MKRMILWAATLVCLAGGVIRPLAAQHVARVDGNDTNAAELDKLLDRTVSIYLVNVPLGQAIRDVAARAQVTVLMDQSVLARYRQPVTLHVQDATLRSAFEQLLEKTTLHVVARPYSRVIVTDAATPVAADSIPTGGMVNGRVVDSATGRGVSGVTIKVAGTKRAVLTTDDGRFTLRDVPRGTQLVTAKAFGYRPAERQVDVTEAQVATTRLVLTSVPNVLSGVVTTATGTQRKLEVGSDITTLNVDSLQQVAPISTVTDLLESRVPGLTVLHSSGTPGDPSRLRLRGASSIQGNNDPIVIVDGIRVYAQQSDARNANLAPGKTGGAVAAPSPVDQIDPNSIETIEVLKGPSATAIYGSDAASGVIVITTKHGRSGPAHWSAELGAGTNWLPGDWPTNYYRFGFNDVNAGPLCNWYDASCEIDSVVAFQALNDSRYTIFDRGGNQQASVTVSGGVPALVYSVTGSATGTQGYLKLPGSEVQRYDSLYGPISRALVRPDRYNTWGMTGSVTAYPRTNMLVGLQSQLFNSTQQRSALDNAVTQLAGTYINPASLTGPLLVGEYERATATSLTSTNALTLHWQPFTWLPLDGTVGLNTAQRNDVRSVPFGVLDHGVIGGDIGACRADPRTSGCSDTTGSYGLGHGTSRVTTIQLGTAVPMFRQRATVAVGTNFYSASTADFSIYTDLLSPGINVPTVFLRKCPNGATTSCYGVNSQSTSRQSTYGWYLEPRLNVASRFFVAPGFRLDGGSGGSRNSGLGGLSAFPKMDFSYLAVDREGDEPLWGFLTQLRPRLAFGYAGTQPASADKLRLYNIGGLYDVGGYGSPDPVGGTNIGSACTPNGGTLDGVTPVQAVCLGSIGNTELHPERSSELEGGFDATLWNGRLSLTYSQYNKTRHDAILPIPIAQSVFSDAGGAASIQKNIGVIRNTGRELQVTATVLEHRLLGWTIGAMVSKNSNLVVRLNQGQPPIVIGGTSATFSNVQTRVQAGYPLFSEFARPILGYVDADGNGIIDANEIRYGDSTVYVGQPDPNYQVTMTHDVSLLQGRLSVHASFAYQNGLTQFNEGACTSQSFLLTGNAPNTSSATQAAISAACAPQGGTTTAKSIIGLVQVVNTFRFQDLSVNYVMPKGVSSWAHVPRMSVALQGSNLALHTNYRGKDPNVNAFSTAGQGDQTADTGQIPLPRSIGLRVTFGN